MTNENNKILKLSSGEEIVCKLKGDEHPRTYEIESPLKINTVPKITEDGIEESISLQRWIHFSEEKVYSISKSQVMIITQASVGLSKFYDYCVNKMDKNYDIEERPSDSELDDIESEEMMEDYGIPSKLLH